MTVRQDGRASDAYAILQSVSRSTFTDTGGGQLEMVYDVTYSAYTSDSNTIEAARHVGRYVADADPSDEGPAGGC